MIGDILQPTHLLFILVIALLVLGPKRLPEVGRSLGRGLRDFRNALSFDDDRPDEVPAHTPVPTATPTAPTPDPAPLQPPSPEQAPTAVHPQPEPEQPEHGQPAQQTAETERAGFSQLVQ